MKTNHAIAVALALSATIISVRAESKTAGKPVAIVNGEPIGREEFDAAWRRVVLPPNCEPAQRKALQRELLDVMINELVLQQFLKRHVPPPDPGLVQARIKALEASLKADGRTLQDFYRDSGQTEAHLRGDIAALVQWNAYAAKRITAEDAQRYYEKHRELFDGVLLRASHIFIRCPASADSRTQQAARQKLQRLRQEILQGLDFSDAARKHSEDGSAARGGDIGSFPPCGPETDTFVRAAAALNVGQLSDIVQTDDGFHLIKLTERKPGRSSTFEEVKEDVRLVCAEELRLQVIAEQRKAARIEMNLPD